MYLVTGKKSDNDSYSIYEEYIVVGIFETEVIAKEVIKRRKEKKNDSTLKLELDFEIFKIEPGKEYPDLLIGISSYTE